MIYYNSDRIKIRDIYEKDIISLFSWNIDKEVNKNDPRPMPSNSVELIEECTMYCNMFNSQIINENIEERKYRYFIITNKKMGKPIV